MKILLSIKPEFVYKIFDGTKKYEYRKTIFLNSNVVSAVVYATIPVGMVVGEFSIKQIHRGSPKEIWNKTKVNSGITWKFFNEYFQGRKEAFAIEIGDKKIFEKPISVKEFTGDNNPPQYFCYIKSNKI